jgi:hypothetical protein
MSIDDIDLVEINEAFAAQVIPSAKHLGISWDKLNVNGGAIALGHPFGMTGARIMTTLLNGLEDRGQAFGLESMCVGGGQGMAMIVERLGSDENHYDDGLPEFVRKRQGQQTETESHAARHEQPLRSRESRGEPTRTQGRYEHADARAQPEESVTSRSGVQCGRDEEDLDDVDDAQGQHEQYGEYDERSKYRTLRNELDPHQRFTHGKAAVDRTGRHPINAQQQRQRGDQQERRTIDEQGNMKAVRGHQHAADERSRDAGNRVGTL